MRAIHHFPYHSLSLHREDLCGLSHDVSSISLKDRKYNAKFVGSSDLVLSCVYSLFQGNVCDVSIFEEYSKCFAHKLWRFSYPCLWKAKESLECMSLREGRRATSKETVTMTWKSFMWAILLIEQWLLPGGCSSTPQCQRLNPRLGNVAPRCQSQGREIQSYCVGLWREDLCCTCTTCGLLVHENWAHHCQQLCHLGALLFQRHWSCCFCCICMASLKNLETVFEAFPSALLRGSKIWDVAAQ